MEIKTMTIGKIEEKLKEAKRLQKQNDKLNDKIASLESENKELERLIDGINEKEDFELLIPDEFRTIRYMDALKKIIGNIKYIPIDELEAIADTYDKGCEAQMPEIEFC